MDGINWNGLNQPNPFANFAEGLRFGADMRQQRERTDLLRQRQQLEVQKAQREQALADEERARRAAVGGAVAKGDYAGARTAAAGDFDMIGEINKMDAEQRKVARENAADLGGFAAGIAKVPYEQRKGIIAQAKPILSQRGFTPEQIDAFDPTDANLQALTASAMDLKTALEQSDREADNKRADAQLSETQRHNRSAEGTAAANARTAASNAARGWAAHNARVKAGGYGTPGVGAAGIPDSDVEID